MSTFCMKAKHLQLYWNPWVSAGHQRERNTIKESLVPYTLEPHTNHGLLCVREINLLLVHITVKLGFQSVAAKFNPS